MEGWWDLKQEEMQTRIQSDMHAALKHIQEQVSQVLIMTELLICVKSADMGADAETRTCNNTCTNTVTGK